MAEKLSMSLEQVGSLSSGLSHIDSGLFTAAGALVKSNNQDSRLYQKVLEVRAGFEELVEQLDPAVFFEGDASVDRTVASMASDERG